MSVNMSALFLITFLGISVSWHALEVSNFGIFSRISSLFIFEKEKCNLWWFLLHTYPDGFYILRHIQNRISDIGSRKFTVWIFCDIKVTFKIAKESIQNFTSILLFDATLFYKNGLILPKPVNSSGNFWSLQVLIHLTKCSSFSPAITCHFLLRNLRFRNNFSYF